MTVMIVMLLSLFLSAPASAEPVPFDALKLEFENSVQPILQQTCIRCHNAERQEADLNLERFSGPEGIRQEPRVWQKALFMLENNEMPPKKSKQLTAEEKAAFISWIDSYLDAEAHAGAGDPGNVVLRRLSNAEYDNTIRDLTGVDLKPTREFPVDSAAGEGFTNAGESMVMSPALLEKYLDATRDIASHVVFLPDGIRFSQATARRDQADEVLDKIREIHALDSESQRVQLPGAAAGQTWSRANLVRYFRALVEHRDRLRENPSAARAIAQEKSLNAIYFGHLTDFLVSDAPSVLLAQVQARLRNPETTPDAAEEVASTIEASYAHLWDMKTVSQRYETGLFAKDRTVDQQEIRVKLPADLDRTSVSLSLVTGDAGDGGTDDTVFWENPRIESPIGPPVRLQDVRPLMRKLDTLRQETFAHTKDYLDAVAILASDGSVDLAKVIADRKLDENVLDRWLAHLSLRPGLANPSGPVVAVSDHMLPKQEKVGGDDHVFGRVHPDGNPSIIVNASFDRGSSIAIDLPPRTVAVHPSPSHYCAVGWQSPIDGVVRVQTSLIDVSTACGNGIAWALNLTQGPSEHSLASGQIDARGRTGPHEIELVNVSKGDLIALLVGPRGGDYTCDTTRINLVITETTDQLRSWNLAADIVDSILAKNPLDDRYGHKDVWHIYTGEVGPRGELGGTLPGHTRKSVLPAGSVLARWRTAVLEGKTNKAERLANEAHVLLTTEPEKDTPFADREALARTRSVSSALFRQVDYAEFLARDAALRESRSDSDGIFGLPEDAFDEDGHLVHRAPQAITISLPTDLVAGGDFVTTVRLAPDAEDGTAQVRCTVGAPIPLDGSALDLPVITREGTAGHERTEKAFEDYRNLFPRFLCCQTTVPVDEVVTLVMYHREDAHLSRLMLTEEQRARLNRLWGEVHYISQDAIKIHEYFPLIMGFATQVGHEYRYRHLEEPIRKTAEEFQQHLRDTQPAQLDALIAFAARAFRRPLTKPEEWTLRAMYATLRGDEETHEDAFRAVLARVLASPNFLYRVEEPGPGEEPAPVTDWELATRLSYFLWSSMPDAQLLAAADEASFVEPDGLLEQASRMLKDERVRGLATEFACQWLGVRGFDSHDEKNERQYPTFADLRDDMYEETLRFFEDLFRRNGSVLELLDADHTFVNGALARHYEIDGIEGDDWQRVSGMKQQSRGGVLGMATMLAKQSGATRTSPVLRGFWVVETLLGEELPDPPATVPELPDALSREGLTVRQMTEKHVSEESCAGCHVRIDPYGFALESFDAIGRFRTRDLIDQPVDTQVKLRDGTEFKGIEGLRAYLLESRRNDFLEQFSRKLLGFALGRAVELSDQPLIDTMVQQLNENGYRFSAAVEAIITSKQFRFHRGLEATRPEPI